MITKRTTNIYIISEDENLFNVEMQYKSLYNRCKKTLA